MSEYRLTLENRSIVWGASIDIEPLIGKFSIDSIKQQENKRVDWNLPSGVYRAKDIVIELDKLLEAIIVQLGEMADPETLLENLQANLAISGRESVLPLGPLSFEDKAGAELTLQAKRIGEGLTHWARELNSQKRSLKQYGESVLNDLKFRSHCDHHLLTPKANALLFGPTGGPEVMQLFNELLHQFVLLRDALIPFDNWEEVPIEVKESENAKGLRFLEQARTEFLTELMVRKISHKALIKYAQSVLSSGLSTVGYGFQYRLGTILPASLGASVAVAPRYLLHWYPVQTVLNGTSDEPAAVAFDYEYHDYYSAPRSMAGTSSAIQLEFRNQELGDASEAQIIVGGDGSDRIVLQISLQFGSANYVVDLGQAFRGHRFMYRPKTTSKPDSGTVPVNPTSISEHHAWDILRLAGLVTNDSGIHFITAGGNDLVLWALLGKLYPENVIVLDSVEEDEIEAAKISGKGFGTKFLIR
ncbi:hypothetical protein [Paenibacillus sp. Soil724D2]|uniref:hypothetical protein n=1 Tax=Paenibacillus sp. (strain Soil724D2) TaxID=1736392 RepID=UPI0007145AF0|nr:hypothetical protein [Paenibacillus sp. Soil724D2]KRE36536.1 hypothetical protein ASG85_10290 [Paenibacillus sp. Soil724D2]